MHVRIRPLPRVQTIMEGHEFSSDDEDKGPPNTPDLVRFARAFCVRAGVSWGDESPQMCCCVCVWPIALLTMVARADFVAPMLDVLPVVFFGCQRWFHDQGCAAAAHSSCVVLEKVRASVARPL